MVGRVGGNLEDLGVTSTLFTDTAASAEESGALGVQLSEQMEGGLDEVTRVLETRFGQLAEEFRARAMQTQAGLADTDWEGQRRARAVEVGEQLRTDVDTVIANTDGYVRDFRSRTVATAVAAVEAMRAEFQGAMSRADERYRQLGAEAAHVREELTNLDAGGLS